MENKIKTAEEFHKEWSQTTRLFENNYQESIEFGKAYAGYYHKQKQGEVMEFLKLILSSYKLLNDTRDYQQVYQLLVTQAETLHNKILSQQTEQQ